MKKLGLLVRKPEKILRFIEKQLFILTELVVKLARVYYDSQEFIRDLHPSLQPSHRLNMARVDSIDVICYCPFSETYPLRFWGYR